MVTIRNTTLDVYMEFLFLRIALNGYIVVNITLSIRLGNKILASNYTSNVADRVVSCHLAEIVVDKIAY